VLLGVSRYGRRPVMMCHEAILTLKHFHLLIIIRVCLGRDEPRKKFLMI